MKKHIPLLFAALLTSGAAQAALLNRGGGLIYDDDLNITWLQDANYAKTSGYSDTLPTAQFNNGKMTWYEATNWIGQLDFGSVTGWRLPTQSEMEHLHYAELGNLLYSDPDWIPVIENAAPFFNVGESHYWSIAPGFVFNFKEGTSNSNSSLDMNLFHAWAVRDGDVAAVPEPETYAMMLAGLGLVGFMARRKKKTEV